jgi:cytidine deaminase
MVAGSYEELSREVEVAPPVDALLLDSGRLSGAVKELEGTGRTHDWSVSRKVREMIDVPAFLAGGLGSGAKFIAAPRKKQYRYQKRQGTIKRTNFHPIDMSRSRLSAGEKARLFHGAQEATQKAYAPYSKFRVGAALMTTEDEVFLGCNVENASYGMTNCAERTAIFAAVAKAGPKMKIRALAVMNDRGADCSPCGACRQVIYEFGPDAMVFFQHGKGWRQSHITKLLPGGFRLK